MVNQPLSEAAKKILLCCRQGQLKQLLDIVESGLDIAEVNHPDFAPLNVALKHGRWKIAKHLLENQIIPIKVSSPPLIAATQYKKDMTQGMEMVFSHTADLDVVDRNGRTALMTACLLGHEKKVAYLLQDPNGLHQTDHFGMNAFLDTVISQSNQILEMLISHDVDVHHHNLQLENALLIAVQQQNPNHRIIKSLLENQVDCTQKNIQGKSALDVAEKKHPTIHKLFITKIETDKQMELPLFVEPDQSSTVEQIVNNEKKPTIKTNKDNDLTKQNPYSQQWFNAISEGNLGRINQLKVKGVPIDLTDNKGCTGLIHAAGKGHRAVASYLIQNNANVEFQSNNGSTPLSSAIMSNSRALVGLLLSNGANANGSGPGGYPCVSLAATQWSEACLSMLLDAGAHVDTIDEYGMSLYHHVVIAAEYYGNTAKAKHTLRLIHQNDLDINTQNAQGNTALHIICGGMKERKYQVDDSHIANITHEMLKLEANPKIVNNQGFTAIQYAKKHSLLNTKGVIKSFIDTW